MATYYLIKNDALMDGLIAALGVTAAQMWGAMVKPT